MKIIMKQNNNVFMVIGDIHLESVVAKLKSKFKIDVKLSDMKVSYRETIRKKLYSTYKV